MNIQKIQGVLEKKGDLLFRYAWSGILFAAPFVVTLWAIHKLAIFILEKLEIFLPGVSHEEIVSNKLWYVVAFFIAFTATCLLGYIATRTVFGKTINHWCDKNIRKMKGVGPIYGVANDFAQQFEKKESTTAKPVLMPCTNSVMLQIGQIMSEEKVLLYNPHLKRAVPHCSVLFKSAYGVFVGTAYLVPEELIEEHEKYYLCTIPTDEAVKFNLTGGAEIPSCFVRKESKK